MFPLQRCIYVSNATIACSYEYTLKHIIYSRFYTLAIILRKERSKKKGFLSNRHGPVRGGSKQCRGFRQSGLAAEIPPPPTKKTLKKTSEVGFIVFFLFYTLASFLEWKKNKKGNGCVVCISSLFFPVIQLLWTIHHWCIKMYKLQTERFFFLSVCYLQTDNRHAYSQTDSQTDRFTSGQK